MCYKIWAGFLLLILVEYAIIIRTGKEVICLVILGVDPGYAVVGWGCVRYEKGRYFLMDYGTVTTPADMDFPERLYKLHIDLIDKLNTLKPDVLAVEKLYFKNNQKTAIDVAQARGVIVLTARQLGIPVYEYTPLQVKSAVTGFGKAEKQQVMEMTRRLLGLKEVPRPDDAADALAIAICHANTCGTPLKERLSRMKSVY